MKLFRGISSKKLKEYEKLGIPIGTNFLNAKKDAKMYGDILIEASLPKRCWKYNVESDIFKTLKMRQKYFKNACKIKRFKII